MSKKKKKKSAKSKAKRQARQRRIQMGRSWLVKYKGKNVLRGYCKHFGVDWQCAVIELTTLGMSFSADYVARRKKSDADAARARLQRAQQRKLACTEDSNPYPDIISAWLDKAYEYLADFEEGPGLNETWRDEMRDPGFLDDQQDLDDDVEIPPLVQENLSKAYPDVDDDIPF